MILNSVSGISGEDQYYKMWDTDTNTLTLTNYIN